MKRQSGIQLHINSAHKVDPKQTLVQQLITKQKKNATLFNFPLRERNTSQELYKTHDVDDQKSQLLIKSKSFIRFDDVIKHRCNKNNVICEPYLIHDVKRRRQSKIFKTNNLNYSHVTGKNFLNYSLTTRKGYFQPKCRKRCSNINTREVPVETKSLISEPCMSTLRLNKIMNRSSKRLQSTSIYPDKLRKNNIIGNKTGGNNKALRLLPKESISNCLYTEWKSSKAIIELLKPRENLSSKSAISKKSIFCILKNTSHIESNTYYDYKHTYQNHKRGKKQFQKLPNIPSPFGLNINFTADYYKNQSMPLSQKFKTADNMPINNKKRSRTTEYKQKGLAQYFSNKTVTKNVNDLKAGHFLKKYFNTFKQRRNENTTKTKNYYLHQLNPITTQIMQTVPNTPRRDSVSRENNNIDDKKLLYTTKIVKETYNLRNNTSLYINMDKKRRMLRDQAQYVLYDNEKKAIISPFGQTFYALNVKISATKKRPVFSRYETNPKFGDLNKYETLSYLNARKNLFKNSNLIETASTKIRSIISTTMSKPSSKSRNMLSSINVERQLKFHPIQNNKDSSFNFNANIVRGAIVRSPKQVQMSARLNKLQKKNKCVTCPEGINIHHKGTNSQRKYFSVKSSKLGLKAKCVTVNTFAQNKGKNKATMLRADKIKQYEGDAAFSIPERRYNLIRKLIKKDLPPNSLADYIKSKSLVMKANNNNNPCIRTHHMATSKDISKLENKNHRNVNSQNKVATKTGPKLRYGVKKNSTSSVSTPQMSTIFTKHNTSKKKSVHFSKYINNNIQSKRYAEESNEKWYAIRSVLKKCFYALGLQNEIKHDELTKNLEKKPKKRGLANNSNNSPINKINEGGKDDTKWHITTKNKIIKESLNRKSNINCFIFNPQDKTSSNIIYAEEIRPSLSKHLKKTSTQTESHKTQDVRTGFDEFVHKKYLKDKSNVNFMPRHSNSISQTPKMPLVYSNKPPSQYITTRSLSAHPQKDFSVGHRKYTQVLINQTKSNGQKTNTYAHENNSSVSKFITKWFNTFNGINNGKNISKDNKIKDDRNDYGDDPCHPVQQKNPKKFINVYNNKSKDEGITTGQPDTRKQGLYKREQHCPDSRNIDKPFQPKINNYEKFWKRRFFKVPVNSNDLNGDGFDSSYMQKRRLYKNYEASNTFVYVNKYNWLPSSKKNIGILTPNQVVKNNGVPSTYISRNTGNTNSFIRKNDKFLLQNDNSRLTLKKSAQSMLNWYQKRTEKLKPVLKIEVKKNDNSKKYPYLKKNKFKQNVEANNITKTSNLLEVCSNNNTSNELICHKCLHTQLESNASKPIRQSVSNIATKVKNLIFGIFDRNKIDSETKAELATLRDDDPTLPQSVRDPLLKLIVDKKTMNVLNREDIVYGLGTGRNETGVVKQGRLAKQKRLIPPPVLNMVINRDNAKILSPGNHPGSNIDKVKGDKQLYTNTDKIKKQSAIYRCPECLQMKNSLPDKSQKTAAMVATERAKIESISNTCLRLIRQSPCECGNTVCKKERALMNQDKKKRKAKIKPCTCGSYECELAVAKKYTKSSLKSKFKHKNKKFAALKQRRKQKQLKRQSQLEDREAKHVRDKMRQEKEHRLKRYAREDAILRKRRKKEEKQAMKRVEKIKNATGCLLLAESVMDIGKLGTNVACSLLKSSVRAIINPKGTCRKLTEASKDPNRALHRIYTSFKGSVASGTVKRIQHRCRGMKTLKFFVNAMESHPITNYLLHFRDPKKRLKKIKRQKDPPDYECNLYMGSLRKRPCLWVYFLCPWFYPHCISLIGIWRQFTDVLLFILAVGVWSPCILCTEMCRALLCCCLYSG